MQLGLRQKVALVTGGGRGIGAAIAAELAAEGMQVCLVARDPAALDRVAAALSRGNAVQASTFATDLRAPDAAAAAVPAAIAAAVARFGRLDLPVNNAGATRRGDVFGLTEDEFQDGFALKSHGAVRMMRAADFTIGGSVNAALLNFTKAMADIGISHTVRVNAINPGLIETDRFRRNVGRIMQERAVQLDEAVRSLLASHGTTRVGQPEEIGALVAYLASVRADFIQGSIVDIDGGATRSL